MPHPVLIKQTVWRCSYISKMSAIQRQLHDLLIKVCMFMKEFGSVMWKYILLVVGYNLDHT
jgi:hypothetical protein